jgi:N-acetylornithine carbamoyltransferase
MRFRGRDFLSLGDFSSAEVNELIEAALAAKAGSFLSPLDGKTLVAIFFNPSLRTRLSFQVAMERLGGRAIIVNAGSDLWALEFEDGTVMDGRAGEHVKDAARVLERYADAIAVRAFPRFSSWEEDRQDRVLTSFAREAAAPVINMESSLFHPCQGLADAMTMRERLGEVRGRPILITWTWHPKALPMAVTHSALLAAAHLGMAIRLTCPPGYDPDLEVLKTARTTAGANGGSLDIFHDQKSAAEGAAVVYAKSWGSTEWWRNAALEQEKRAAYRSWQVTEELMAGTHDAFFMHCLRVRRNVVVADSILDGSRAAVYDEAENRMWGQMAVLSALLGS